MFSVFTPWSLLHFLTMFFWISRFPAVALDVCLAWNLLLLSLPQQDFWLRLPMRARSMGPAHAHWSVCSLSFQLVPYWCSQKFWSYPWLSCAYLIKLNRICTATAENSSMCCTLGMVTSSLWFGLLKRFCCCCWVMGLKCCCEFFGDCFPFLCCPPHGVQFTHVVFGSEALSSGKITRFQVL